MNRQEQKANTGNLILETALHRFAEDGLTAARTSDIAAAANLPHGSLFVHFPTREALLDAAITEFGTRITGRLHELAGGYCGMKELLEAHLKGLEEYEAFYTRLICESSLLPESARNTLTGIQSAISFHLLETARHEMETSAIRKMPFHLLFNTWTGLVHYYLMNGDLFAPEGSVLARYGRQLVEHMMDLIRY